jgi:hypothetical protein
MPQANHERVVRAAMAGQSKSIMSAAVVEVGSVLRKCLVLCARRAEEVSGMRGTFRAGC